MLILVEDMLLDLGAKAVETAMRLEEAVEIARRAEVDVAVLDVNLRSKRSYPVAEVLRERGIPYLFASGSGSAEHGTAWKGTPTLKKPFQPRDLARAPEAVMRSAA